MNIFTDGIEYCNEDSKGNHATKNQCNHIADQDDVAVRSGTYVVLFFIAIYYLKLKGGKKERKGGYFGDSYFHYHSTKKEGCNKE